MAQHRKETEAEVHGSAVVPAGSRKKPAAFWRNTTQLMGIIIKQCFRTEQDTRSLCGAIFDKVIMSTEQDVVKSMRAQRGSPGSWQRPDTGPTSDLGMVGIDRGSPEAGYSGRSRQCSDSDRLLQAIRRHAHGHEVRPRQMLQGRPDVPIRTSSQYSVGRQVRRARPSRERAATAGSSMQVRQSTADPAVLANSNSGWTPHSTSRK